MGRRFARTFSLDLSRLLSAVLVVSSPVTMVDCGGEEVDGDDPTDPFLPDDPDDPDLGPCPTPQRLVGDLCVDPGVQDDGCPAGTLGVDGECLPAGLTPADCAEGFVHDGERGCLPVLPEAPCPPGEMALPGETTCQPLMDCGTGTWGNIPVEADTVYVSDTATGKGEGTMAKPFTSIMDAVAAAPEGAIVAIAAGTYYDIFLVDRPVRLWGRCPSMVQLGGIFADGARVVVQADGVELRGVSMTGLGGGVLVSNAADVVLDRLWLHELTAEGVAGFEDTGSTSFTVSRTLIEGARDIGIGLFGGTATVVDTVVRSTAPDAEGDEGRGINAQRSSSGAAAAMEIDRVVVRDSDVYGVFASDADVSLNRVVVLDTEGHSSDGSSGQGIVVQTIDSGAATARVTSSYVARSRYFGVGAFDIDAEIEGLVVEQTRPRASDGAGGIPLGVLTVDEGRSIAVRSSRLKGGSSIGLSASGRGITVEGVAIAGIAPEADGRGGVGLVMRNFADETPGQLTARGIHVESEADFGVYVGGAEAVVDGLEVQVAPEDGGWGIFAVFAADLPSQVALRGSVVTGAQGFGVSAFGSHVALEGTVVRDTLASAEGTYGDGLSVATLDEGGSLRPGSALLRSSRLSDNARAGVASLGGTVELRQSAATCNDLDLTSQSFGGQQAQLSDLGGNLCGCPEGAAACQVIGSEVSVPAPPGPPARNDALGDEAPEPTLP